MDVCHDLLGGAVGSEDVGVAAAVEGVDEMVQRIRIRHHVPIPPGHQHHEHAVHVVVVVALDELYERGGQREAGEIKGGMENTSVKVLVCVCVCVCACVCVCVCVYARTHHHFTVKS